ncbi:hypothetical protein [uncultured Zhongshania sp.]|uniref:hypothetical protein n=1 Tax=uncultured Zhongshania sp. TaxID=1642288 RepID=UPI0025D70E5E|nr:hypothetical protein [uncultured Zhongshania sp.]
MYSELKEQRGQALPEYIVGTLVVVAVLFTPIEVFGGRAIIGVLVESFQKNYKGYEYVVSQPVDE